MQSVTLLGFAIILGHPLEYRKSTHTIHGINDYCYMLHYVIFLFSNHMMLSIEIKAPLHVKRSLPLQHLWAGNHKYKLFLISQAIMGICFSMLDFAAEHARKLLAPSVIMFLNTFEKWPCAAAHVQATRTKHAKRNLEAMSMHEKP